jgi:hypothetical protein
VYGVGLTSDPPLFLTNIKWAGGDKRLPGKDAWWLWNSSNGGVEDLVLVLTRGSLTDPVALHLFGYEEVDPHLFPMPRGLMRKLSDFRAVNYDGPLYHATHKGSELSKTHTFKRGHTTFFSTSLETLLPVAYAADGYKYPHMTVLETTGLRFPAALHKEPPYAMRDALQVLPTWRDGTPAVHGVQALLRQLRDPGFGAHSLYGTPTTDVPAREVSPRRIEAALRRVGGYRAIEARFDRFFDSVRGPYSPPSLSDAEMSQFFPAQKNRRRVRRNGAKTSADLRRELTWLGPGVVAELIFGGTTKQCQHTSLAVARYLAEQGFSVRTAGGGTGKYAGHYDLGVFTADEGWISVDPTAIQFHAPISLSAAHAQAMDALPDHMVEYKRGRYRFKGSRAEAEAITAQVFEPTIKWSVRGIREGLPAFEVTKSPLREAPKPPIRPAPPDEYYKSWREWWEERRQLAMMLKRGELPDEFLNPTFHSYWGVEVARRLGGKR